MWCRDDLLDCFATLVVHCALPIDSRGRLFISLLHPCSSWKRWTWFANALHNIVRFVFGSSACQQLGVQSFRTEEVREHNIGALWRNECCCDLVLCSGSIGPPSSIRRPWLSSDSSPTAALVVAASGRSWAPTWSPRSLTRSWACRRAAYARALQPRSTHAAAPGRSSLCCRAARGTAALRAHELPSVQGTSDSPANEEPSSPTRLPQRQAAAYLLPCLRGLQDELASFLTKRNHGRLWFVSRSPSRPQARELPPWAQA